MKVERVMMPDPAGLPNIVAFCGFAGAGKSTAAKALLGWGYMRHALAAPLKAAMEAMGVPRAHILDPALKEQPLDLLGGKSARYAMQTLGTEWGRGMIDDQLWLRCWQATKLHPLTVVDDLRFPNEAQYLRQQGARIYRVERSAMHSDAHPSEQAHLDIAVDGVFRNGDNVTVDVLQETVRMVIANAAS